MLVITWQEPTHRVNGDSVTSDDIAGYEVRANCGDDYQYFIVEKNEFNTAGLIGTCSIEVAAIDKYGIYSKYSDKITVNLNDRIQAPMRGGIR